MKKTFQVPPSAVEGAEKYKTLMDNQLVVLLTFTASSAALYFKKEDAPASVTRRGGANDLDAISKQSVISVADFGFNDTRIIVAAPSQNELVIRNSDANSGGATGAILFYGKPSGCKIHVRLVSNRAAYGMCEQFAVNSLDKLWLLKAILEPIIISWGFRLNWHRIVEYVFGITVIVRNHDETRGEDE